MYETLLATSPGLFILALVFDPRIVARMLELSNRGLPAVGALSGGLPVQLPNRYKRLARPLVKCMMRSRGYAPVPGCGRRIPGSSLFKRGHAIVQPVMPSLNSGHYQIERPCPTSLRSVE